MRSIILPSVAWAGLAVATISLGLSPATPAFAGPAKPARAAPLTYRVLPPVKLYPGIAPGSETWAYPEKVIGAAPHRVLQNVVSPDYVAYLPTAKTNTGTSVIIAPGGGNVMLSYDSEGIEVARWLAERGIAAFVLKYRVRQTDPRQHPVVALRSRSDGKAPPALDLSPELSGVADGMLALRMIRQRASEYGIRPDRVVMLGFSAGARVVTGAALQDDAAARPNFVAPIYGATSEPIPALPPGLPPMFLAVAQDDKGAGPTVDRFYQALIAAGYQPEYHRFQAGGHGFGMDPGYTTSDHWIDLFYWWLQGNGLAQKPGEAPWPRRQATALPPGLGGVPVPPSTPQKH